MDLAFLESVSTDASAMTNPAIQPLQNQAILWGLRAKFSVVNARQATSAVASV